MNPPHGGGGKEIKLDFLFLELFQPSRHMDTIKHSNNKHPFHDRRLWPKPNEHWSLLDILGNSKDVPADLLYESIFFPKNHRVVDDEIPGGV